MSDTRYAGKSAAQQRAEHIAWAQQQTARFLCAVPGCTWHYTGTLTDGRDKHQAHRATKHPERTPAAAPRRARTRTEIAIQMARNTGPDHGKQQATVAAAERAQRLKDTP